MDGWIGPFNTGPAAGAPGAATATATTDTCVDGVIRAVSLAFNGTCPAGTIISTVATAGQHAPAYTILTRTHSKATGPFEPTLTAQDTTGADRTYDGNAAHPIAQEIPVDDHLAFTVDGVNAGDSVDFYVYLEDEE
jgi:hypothetical protein